MSQPQLYMLRAGTSSLVDGPVSDRLRAARPADFLRLCNRFQPVPHALAPGVHAVSLALSLLRPWEDLPVDPATSQWAPRRRLAFIAGRLCAEQALREAGAPRLSVRRGPHGEPTWPENFTGSITHTDESAFAAVMRCDRARLGVGIDSEPQVSLQAAEDVRRVCCVAEEAPLLFDGTDDRMAATLLFSSKEALFKAIHRAVRRFVDFDEFRAVEFDRGQRRLVLQAVPGNPLRQLFAQCPVYWRFVDGVVHTTAITPLPETLP